MTLPKVIFKLKYIPLQQKKKKKRREKPDPIELPQTYIFMA